MQQKDSTAKEYITKKLRPFLWKRPQLLFLFLRLVGRTELMDHLNNFLGDRICARFQQLTRVIALAFQILARFDVFTGSIREDQLQFRVHVDLGNAQGDGLGNLIRRDAGCFRRRRQVHGRLQECCRHGS